MDTSGVSVGSNLTAKCNVSTSLRDNTSQQHHVGSKAMAPQDVQMARQRPDTKGPSVLNLNHSSGHVAQRPSLRMLLPRRAISGGQGIAGGDAAAPAELDSGTEESAFVSAEQAGDEAAGYVPFVKQQAQLVHATTLLPPLAAYASEGGTTWMQPAPLSLGCRDTGMPYCSPGSAPPVVLDRVPGHPAALGNAMPADAMEAALCFANLADNDFQDLLQPCGNPCLPMESGWRELHGGTSRDVKAPGSPLVPGIGRRRHSGGAAFALPSSLYMTVEQELLCSVDAANGQTQDHTYDAATGATAAAPDGQPQDALNGGDAHLVDSARHGNRHRACEFGYTSSAPVHAVAVARRDVEQLFLRNAAAFKAEQQILNVGALSAPTASACAATRDGAANATSKSDMKAPAATMTAPRLILGPPVVSAQSQGEDGPSRPEPGATGPEGRPSLAVSSSSSIRNGKAGGSWVTGRQMTSSARAARHAVLGSAAAAAVASGWFAGSGGTSLPRYHASVSDFADRQSASSNLFGTALAVGLSTLLDNIGVEPVGPSKAEHQALGCSSSLAPNSSWLRARGQARLLGHRLFGCLVASSAPATPKTRYD